LLDTSALLALGGLTDPSRLPNVALISAVTLAELSIGPLVATDDGERAKRLAHLQQAEADFDPIPFDAAAARAFGRVALAYRRTGRKPSAHAIDALIAATAIANGLPLYTANPQDFAGLDELVVRSVEPTTDVA
jgi:predicted nucleic acid-binding protein